MRFNALNRRLETSEVQRKIVMNKNAKIGSSRLFKQVQMKEIVYNDSTSRAQ